MFFLFSIVSLPLFANNHLNENNRILADTKLVIQKSKSVFIDQHHNRLYLDRDRLSLTPNGIYIVFDDGDSYFTKNAQFDQYGVYLPIPIMDKPEPKPFICVCNTCGHKWFGGVFASHCPRTDCQSTDIKVVPNGW